MMSLCHSWGYHPIQTASHIHIRHIQSVWAHGQAVHRQRVTALHRYPPYLGQIMEWIYLCHGWGCHPIQTASHIHFKTYKKCINTSYTDHIHRHWVAALHRYSPYLGQIMVLWVSCWVKMMSLCHGGGCHPIQTASCIHIRHIQSVWAHWYAVHRHTVAAYTDTHHSRVRFWYFRVTCGVRMMSLCHGWCCHPIQTASHIHIRHYSKCLSTWTSCP